MDQLWELERRFWLEGTSVYETYLHEDAFIIFPGMGVLDRAAVIESLRAARRWAEVEMRDRRHAGAGDAVVLAYAAEARRNGERPYRAFCSSTYVAAPDGWAMVMHQQTQWE